MRTWVLPEYIEDILPAQAARIERLRRELARMKAERDILKKAAAYFARDSI